MAIEYYIKQRHGKRKIVGTYETSEQAQRQLKLVSSEDFCVVYSPDALKVYLEKYGNETLSTM